MVDQRTYFVVQSTFLSPDPDPDADADGGGGGAEDEPWLDSDPHQFDQEVDARAWGRLLLEATDDVDYRVVERTDRVVVAKVTPAKKARRQPDRPGRKRIGDATYGTPFQVGEGGVEPYPPGTWLVDVEFDDGDRFLTRCSPEEPHDPYIVTYADHFK
ncbi:MAG TPA: hypothetical protein VF163_18465 [Micromonosporaceae bacterium]